MAKTQVSPKTRLRKTGRPRREKKRGITLLPTLLAFLSIASILTVLQARELAQMRVMGRLIETQREALDRQALHVLVTGDIAAGMLESGAGAPTLDGSPIIKRFDGRDWTVRLQDVEGLIDLYLSSQDVLDRAGLNGRDILRKRAQLTETQRGGRLPSLTQSAAFFAVPDDMLGWVTQSSRFHKVRLRTLPAGLHQMMNDLPARDRLGGQVQTVRVELSLPR